MKLSRVGVDFAKNVFHLHGVDRKENPVWRRRLKREKWLKALLDTVESGCEIGMEACAGAHHWARELQAQGFTVKLMAVWSKNSSILRYQYLNTYCSCHNCFCVMG
jgi:transposase